MTTTHFSRYVIAAAVFVATVASSTPLFSSREWAAVVEEVTGLPGTANATATTSFPFPVGQRNVSDVRLGSSTTAAGVAKKTPRIHGGRGVNGKKNRNKHKKNKKQNRRNRNNKFDKLRISKAATNIVDTSDVRTLQPMVVSSEATKEITEERCVLAKKQFEHTKFMQLFSTYVLLTMLVIFVTILIVFVIKDCTCNYP
ncbi:Hypothetical protein CINCED_3A005006 [Cinara cedri]|uniref:Uncharacterized protein n=1 Tax=Cinara cedri TaxID=506608 RepID=A0A5E4MJM3_9HEMI|nr:Hypothetical protein CINCED_3A005006 [Cinara cedri]